MAGDPEKYQMSHFSGRESLYAYRYPATPPRHVHPQPSDGERKRRKRPTIILTALCILLLSSGIGLTITVLLMLKPVTSQTASLSRDLIFFSALLSLLYAGLHIHAAMRDYRWTASGPPFLRGNYLHAGALLSARLAIILWIISLIATVVSLVKDSSTENFADKLPFVNLLVCLIAITSFSIISSTIERHATPFATTGLSSPALLTRQADGVETSDQMGADESASRRGSLANSPKAYGHKQGDSPLTISSPEIFRPPKSHRNTKRTGLAKSTMTSPEPPGTPSPRNRATTTMEMEYSPENKPYLLPKPTYQPGSWRAEWNSVAEQVGLPALTDACLTACSDISMEDSESNYSTTLAGSSSSCTYSPSKSSPPPECPGTRYESNKINTDKRDSQYSSGVSAANTTNNTVHPVNPKLKKRETTDSTDTRESSRPASKNRKYLNPPSFSIPRSVRRSLLFAAQRRTVSVPASPSTSIDAIFEEGAHEPPPDNEGGGSATLRTIRRFSRLNKGRSIFNTRSATSTPASASTETVTETDDTDDMDDADVQVDTAVRVPIEELAEQRRHLVYSPATMLFSDAGSEILCVPGGGGVGGSSGSNTHTNSGGSSSPRGGFHASLSPSPSVRLATPLPPHPESPIPFALCPGAGRAARGCFRGRAGSRSLTVTRQRAASTGSTWSAAERKTAGGEEGDEEEEEEEETYQRRPSANYSRPIPSRTASSRSVASSRYYHQMGETRYRRQL